MSGPKLYRHFTIDRRQILNWVKLKEFVHNNFRCGKNGENFIDTIKGKTSREKEKLLVTSNFSSLNVFINLYVFTLDPYQEARQYPAYSATNENSGTVLEHLKTPSLFGVYRPLEAIYQWIEPSVI